jgi:hypothetical protein
MMIGRDGHDLRVPNMEISSTIWGIHNWHHSRFRASMGTWETTHSYVREEWFLGKWPTFSKSMPVIFTSAVAKRALHGGRDHAGITSPCHCTIIFPNQALPSLDAWRCFERALSGLCFPNGRRLKEPPGPWINSTSVR